MASSVRRRGKISGAGGNTDSAGFCVICCEGLKQKSANPYGGSGALTRLLGTTTLDAFLKICEVLQVSFLEIQDDWRFEERGGNGETLPFCRICISDFLSVIKLQQQLFEIQKKIEDKVTHIRRNIRNTTTTAKVSVLDVKATKFRSKALLQGSFGNSDEVGTETDTSTTNQTSLSSTPTTVPTFSWNCDNVTNTNGGSNQQINFYTTLQTPQQQASAESNDSSYSPKVEVDPRGPTVSEDYNPQHYDDDEDNYEDGDDPINDEFSEPENEDDNDFQSKPTRRPPQHNIPFFVPTDPGVFGPGPPATHSNKKVSPEKKERAVEHFSSIITDSDGKMFYEGILIIPSTNRNEGYTCGKCGKAVGKAQDTLSLRKTKIHIKGFHLGAYRCEICEKNFTSYDILSQHTSRSHEKGPEPCPICGKPMKLGGNNMRDHTFTHFNAREKEAAVYKPVRKLNMDRRFICKICGKGFYRPNRLRHHEMIHVDAIFRKDFKCTEENCKRAYTTQNALTSHIMVAHDNLNARKKLCPVCGEVVFLKLFKYHRRLHLANKGKPHLCTICGKACLTRPELSAHMERCAKDMKKREGYEFPCDICNKLFLTRRFMLAHRRMVHKSHWKQKVPPKLAKTVSVDNPQEECLDDLNNEGIQLVEGNTYSYLLYELEKLEDGYKCVTCSEEFRGGTDTQDGVEEQVKAHVKFRHSGSFRCNICTKRMISLFEMEAHQRMEHSNLSNFECEICKRKAIPKKAYKRHLWEHKNVWEIADDINNGYRVPEKFTCENQVALKEMGVELNLTCVLCDVPGFDKVEDLYDHRNKTHPDAPVVKAVLQKNPKKRGPKNYEEDGPQDCPHCGKLINSRKQLTKHIYKVHGTYKKKGRTSRSKTGAGKGASPLSKKGGGAKSPKGKSQPVKKSNSSEDELEQDMEEEKETEFRTEIKEEPRSPEISEEEEDPACNWSDYEEEEKKDVKKIKLDTPKVTDSPRRSLRDRGSLRRSRRAVNYAEEQNEDDDEDD